MEINDKSLHSDYGRYISEEGFRDLVAKNAYFRSENRGFADGYDLQNWIEAEQEVCKQCFYQFQEI